MPTGETIPSPVTTTLRLDKLTPEPAQDFCVRLDVVDRLLDRRDLLRLLVGDLGLELLLERHHQLHGVERIGAEVVDERRFVLDVSLVDAKLLGNNLPHTLLDVFHARPFLLDGDTLIAANGSEPACAGLSGVIGRGVFYQNRLRENPVNPCACRR